MLLSFSVAKVMQHKLQQQVHHALLHVRVWNTGAESEHTDRSLNVCLAVKRAHASPAPGLGCGMYRDVPLQQYLRR
jgi:hypothetical protein